MNSSIFEEELAPLKSQIDEAGQKRESLENELHVVESDLEKFSTERQRFDALKEVCNAIDRLAELNADELFWDELPEVRDSSAYVERLRSRAAGFEEEISGFLEKQASIKEQIDLCLDEIDVLNKAVGEAYEREERRQEEFVVEREISSVPRHEPVMPWTKEAESEKRMRKSILIALLVCLVLGGPVPLINVPIPDRSVEVIEIPKRLVKLVKKEPPKVASIPKIEPKQKKEEPEKPKKEPKPEKKQKAKKPKAEKPTPKTKETKVAESGEAAARKRVQNIGVMAFKDAFADLVKDTPVAKIGSETHLSNGGKVKGRAVAQRSLVALQAKGGSSGGISNSGVSRNIGNGNADRLGTGGTEFVRVESAIAGLGESSRPLSDGVASGRTDEEIQIVFDRYKATLYRIYNNELRKDPTLRGKILMRIAIEPDGTVSMCKVESTDLASPGLVEKIVKRIKRFNFGPKEDVERVTILYPIDFLPAG